jgi:hypothetical protein
MARRSRTRWTQWGEAEARIALGELAASGESAVPFARRSGFSSQRLLYWKKRLGEVSAPAAFVAVRLPSGSHARDTIEIRVDGVAVHVREELDVAHVARLVEAPSRQGRALSATPPEATVFQPYWTSIPPPLQLVAPRVSLDWPTALEDASRPRDRKKCPAPPTRHPSSAPRR